MVQTAFLQTILSNKIYIFYKIGKTKDVCCCYLAFLIFFVFFSLHFSMFDFCLFSSFFNVFCAPPPNQENLDSKKILLKYYINT